MNQKGAPLSHFLSIDENAIFNGHTLSPMGNGKIIRSSALRTKSPMSDLNPMPPVSLPDLRPSVSSAPPVSYQGKRPGSSQNVRFAIDKRMSRRPSLKVKPTNVRPNSRLQKNHSRPAGKSLERRSPSEEDRANNFRTRSKSGSPPSRVNSSMGFRTGIQAGQPVSLPPIFNSNDGLQPMSGPTSLTSGYSSMSSRLGTASSSSSVLTPRSSNLKVDAGKVRIFRDIPFLARTLQ